MGIFTNNIYLKVVKMIQKLTETVDYLNFC